MAKELESEKEFVQLSDACDFLEHYHLEHSDDMVTRFRGKGDQPDIYVVSDPAWRAKMANLVKPIFPDERPHGLGTRRRRHF